jgi:hypothetical protein
VASVRIESESHLHGEVIVEHAFPEEHDSILEVLGGLEVPLRPLDGYATTGRPLKPKRHMRSIKGEKRPFLLPVDQAAMNGEIDARMRASGWMTEPVASGDLVPAGIPLDLRGDFARNEVFVEVEFGNAASLYRDFFKFQIANRTGTGQAAVLILATDKFAKFFDSGIATLEAARRTLPFLAIGIQMPIWLIGIEPVDFAPIGERYQSMWELCEQNGLECHSFETALGAQIPVAELPLEEPTEDQSAGSID